MRRVCERVRTTELFAAFAAHYNFAFSFCNAGAGHEKGSVEAKVRYLRSNLFVPVPRVTSMDTYNAKLPAMCMGLRKDHYIKDEPEVEADPHQQRHRASQPRDQEANARRRHVPGRQERPHAGHRQAQVRSRQRMGV